MQKEREEPATCKIRTGAKHPRRRESEGREMYTIRISIYPPPPLSKTHLANKAREEYGGRSEGGKRRSPDWPGLPPQPDDAFLPCRLYGSPIFRLHLLLLLLESMGPKCFPLFESRPAALKNSCLVKIRRGAKSVRELQRGKKFSGPAPRSRLFGILFSLAPPEASSRVR